MRIVETVAQARAALNAHRRDGSGIGFVPTMGALHDGHLSLVRRAKSDNPVCVVSIFVNPIQFGPGEDFAAYPRDLRKDRETAEGAGADLLFHPGAEEMYPAGFSTYVEETALSLPLCGSRRPGHFRGVATVVLKLLQIVAPDRLYLGQKDAQQLRIVQRMVEDLALPVQVIGCPTVREPDGLAMSSRNAHLSKREREAAPGLYAALRKAQDAFAGGERDAKRLAALARREISSRPEFRPEYVELRRWRDFAEVGRVEEPSLLAAALFLGSTRLIDNVRLDPQSPP